jgi:hypothetical protein
MTNYDREDYAQHLVCADFSIRWEYIENITTEYYLIII